MKAIDPHGHADLAELMIHQKRRANRVDDLPMFAAPSVAVETSEKAADSVKGAVRDAHAIILALLTAHDALTCEEIRDRTQWSGDYARPRLWELEGLQLVEKCDGRQGRPLITRPTRRFRHATAYRLTDLGRQRVREAA